MKNETDVVNYLSYFVHLELKPGQTLQESESSQETGQFRKQIMQLLEFFSQDIDLIIETSWMDGKIVSASC